MPSKRHHRDYGEKVPNKPIKRSIYESIFQKSGALEEIIQRLGAYLPHHGRSFEDENVDPIVLRESLADNHPGFRIEFYNEFVDILAVHDGEEHEFTCGDIIMFFGKLGDLMQAEPITLQSNRKMKNESRSMGIIAEDPYFQKRAEKWKLFRIHPKGEIDQSKLHSKIAEVYRKDLRPLFEDPASYKKLSITQKRFLKLCLIGWFDPHGGKH